jgi:4-diphosphocytidyl-2C-methyl-D-erythritol kinase
VYTAWDRLADHPPRPDLADVRAALGSIPELMGLLFNDREAAAFAVQPSLGALAEQATRLCGAPVRMSGSGSALYRLFAAEAPAQAFVRRVQTELAVPALVTRLRTS